MTTSRSSSRSLVRDACALVVVAACGCPGFTVPGPGHLDYVIPLANGYELWRTSREEISVAVNKGSGSERVIPAKVTQLTWNEDFVLAVQASEVSTASYWVIEVPKHLTHGPLTSESFAELRTKLDVPATLTFRSVLEVKKEYDDQRENAFRVKSSESPDEH